MLGPKVGRRFPELSYILKTDYRTTGFMRQKLQIQLTGKRKNKHNKTQQNKKSTNVLLYIDFKKKLH